MQIHLPLLNLPSKQFNIKDLDERTVGIFCSQRRKFVKLTPEEWVRQNFVRFLIDDMRYPAGLIGNEVPIKVGTTTKRCDSIIYGKDGSPVAICEYKATTVALTNAVLCQIFRYNYALKVRYLIISNGLKHYCCKFSDKTEQYEFQTEFPKYEDLH